MRLTSRDADGARGVDQFRPQKRAQGKPGARCTRGLACKIVQRKAHEHTGSAEAVRPSLRNGFNGFLRALPGDRAFLSPSLANESANLTPASRRQDHTTSPSADTAGNSRLVLGTLNQAMAALGSADGLQVHRSWWVAKRAVDETLHCDLRRVPWAKVTLGLLASAVETCILQPSPNQSAGLRLRTMAAKPRRPREPHEPLLPVTFSVAQYCAMTGLSRAVVTHQIDDGILGTIKIGLRRLILAKQA